MEEWELLRDAAELLRRIEAWGKDRPDFQASLLRVDIARLREAMNKAGVS